ncbi:hypothetical protein BDV11DRAFT_176219 [Aspergillus similis]
MARPVQNPPEEPATTHYEEFAREQIAQDDEEWRRIQEHVIAFLTSIYKTTRPSALKRQSWKQRMPT